MTYRHSREGGNPEAFLSLSRGSNPINSLDSRLRGNDGFAL